MKQKDLQMQKGFGLVKLMDLLMEKQKQKVIGKEKHLEKQKDLQKQKDFGMGWLMEKRLVIPKQMGFG